MATRVGIIIPTYNESENVAKIIPKITESLRSHGVEPFIIVVDDDSPDGTWKVAEDLGRAYSVKSVRRQGERGLSSAVIRGFSFADTDIVGFMDADFSHSPDQIIDLIRPLESGQADLVIGSRYVDKGAIGKWPWYRRLASKSATLMAYPFTRAEDPMSGFVFFKRRVIDGVSLNPIGFKIGLEILAKGKYEKLLEVPITFQNRLYGESKLTERVMLDYAKQLWQLLWEVETTIGQFIKFCLVGISGLLVNMVVYSIGIYILHLHYILAALLSFAVAVSSNFILNRSWTFKQVKKGSYSMPARFGRFVLVCLGGLGINLIVLYLAVSFLSLHKILAQLIAILSATLFNFVGSKKWAFAK